MGYFWPIFALFVDTHISIFISLWEMEYEKYGYFIIVSQKHI